MKFSRGRLIDHLHLVVKDLPAARKLYGAIFEVLGIPIGGEAPDHFWADELFISTPDSHAARGELTGRVHLAFQGVDRAMVDRAHAAAVAAGGKDNGAPGERPYHPGYYAGFILDGAGNNLEIVFHGDAKRSAAAVEISF